MGAWQRRIVRRMRRDSGADDVVFELQFGSGEGLEAANCHVHARYFAAWEHERNGLQLRPHHFTQRRYFLSCGGARLTLVRRASSGEAPAVVTSLDRFHSLAADTRRGRIIAVRDLQ